MNERSSSIGVQIEDRLEKFFCVLDSQNETRDGIGRWLELA